MAEYDTHYHNIIFGNILHTLKCDFVTELFYFYVKISI